MKYKQGIDLCIIFAFGVLIGMILVAIMLCLIVIL